MFVRSTHSTRCMLHACLTLVNSSVSRYDFLLRSREGVILGIHKRTVQFQLTRNLFLTLHGHNVRRQQQQLSKFLMRYQQFATEAYYGAAGPNSKMESQQEEAFCVLRFEVSRSVITVQREFRARFRKDAPARYVVRRTLCQYKVRNKFLVNF